MLVYLKIYCKFYKKISWGIYNLNFFDIKLEIQAFNFYFLKLIVSSY